MIDQDKESRRISLRRVFQEKQFKLITPKDKADEFQHETGGSLYLYWKQGKEPNIAIDPRINYSRLLKLSGVSLEETSLPGGLRYGSTMNTFPKTHESFVPGNAKSHVGRMFSVRQDALPTFLETLTTAFDLPSPRTEDQNPSVEKTSKIPQFQNQPLKNKRVPISPEEDEQRRKKQAENGALGEILAKRYEIERLRGLSCPNPEAHVEHVALKDTGAGYDLESDWNGETRYIEVKAGEARVDSFFISSHEVETLTALKERGWIYLVDLSKKDDPLNCVTPISSAGERLAPEGVLKPTQFRATLRG